MPVLVMGESSITQASGHESLEHALFRLVGLGICNQLLALGIGTFDLSKSTQRRMHRIVLLGVFHNKLQ